jgi:dimethylglycine dehydrogenase
MRGNGPMRLRTFTVEARDADVIGDEPIWQAGEVVGWVTSGGYAHASEASVALGYVPVEAAETDGGWEIEVLGERLPAHLQRTPLFDANGSRMRA